MGLTTLAFLISFPHPRNSDGPHSRH
jgi:hypothetical protein